jgi:hypothetical protein
MTSIATPADVLHREGGPQRECPRTMTPDDAAVAVIDALDRESIPPL